MVHNQLLKILKEVGIPDHLIYLLRNLHAGQEATVRTGHGKMNTLQIRKGEQAVYCQAYVTGCILYIVIRKGCTLSPCLFNLYAEYIMGNSGLKKYRLESRLPGEISITSDMQMTPPLWQKVRKNERAS